MTRTRHWMMAAAATVAMGAGLALAAPGDMHRGPGGPGDGGPPPMGMMDGPGMPGLHPRMLERMAGELQLTDDQKQKIKGVFESARPEMDQVRELGRQNAEKLRATKPGDKNYDSVVAEVARSAGDLATRAVTNGAQLRAQVWAVLTPEQRTRLDALQAERRAKMKERMSQRRQRMGGGTP